MSAGALPRLGSAVLVRDRAGRVLVGRRNKEPNRGKWVLPGGKVEPFESVADAAKRELFEETGLQIDVQDQVGVFEIILPPDEHRVIVYSWARPVAGVLRAASDMSDLRFVTPEEAVGLELTPLVREVLQQVDWLPDREGAPIDPGVAVG